MSKQIIHGKCPSKSNCYKIITIGGKNVPARSSLGKTKVLQDYEKSFFLQCNLYRNMNMQGFFEIEIDVFYPNNQADLDNSLKIVMDCLQLVRAIPNDNKCTRIVANKFVDKDRPRIEFELKPASVTE